MAEVTSTLPAAMVSAISTPGQALLSHALALKPALNLLCAASVKSETSPAIVMITVMMVFLTTMLADPGASGEGGGGGISGGGISGELAAHGVHETPKVPGSPLPEPMSLGSPTDPASCGSDGGGAHGGGGEGGCGQPSSEISQPPQPRLQQPPEYEPEQPQ